MLVEINGNKFKGEEIELLEAQDSILPDYFNLKLKDGKWYHIGLDWRGHDVYLGLYEGKGE